MGNLQFTILTITNYIIILRLTSTLLSLSFISFFLRQELWLRPQKQPDYTFGYLLNKAQPLAIVAYTDILTTPFTKILRKITLILSYFHDYPNDDICVLLALNTQISKFLRFSEVICKLFEKF